MARLSTKVIAAEESNVNVVSSNVLDRLKIQQSNFSLPIENLMQVILTHCGGYIPFLDVTYSLRILQKRAWNHGDVTDSRASDVG